jgi:hypothetical protein
MVSLALLPRSRDNLREVLAPGQPPLDIYRLSPACLLGTSAMCFDWLCFMLNDWLIS